jgi:hypothetical protein
VDLISLIIGFVIGVVAISMAIELGWRKEDTQETCKLTDNWSLHELKNPLIVAEKLMMPFPQDAKVVTATKILQEGDIKQHDGVRGNFAVGENRALVFTGEIKKGELALWTIDEAIMKKLRNEFYQLWGDTDKIPRPAISTRTPGALEKEENLIRVQGRVRATVPFRDGFLLRISTEDRVVGVMVDERLDLKGKIVEVEGKLTMEDHPLIQATWINEVKTDIERIE